MASIWVNMCLLLMYFSHLFYLQSCWKLDIFCQKNHFLKILGKFSYEILALKAATNYFENLSRTILTYAVFGTIINAMGIGFTLWGAYLAGAFGDFGLPG